MAARIWTESATPVIYWNSRQHLTALKTPHPTDNTQLFIESTNDKIRQKFLQK